jgi:hypothetical protein
MKNEVYNEKVNTRNELGARIMNSAAVLKQGSQDDIMFDARTIVNIAETAVKSMVGFLKN